MTPIALEPGLTLVRAPNPSPMTERGTNTYLLGRDRVAVIDPGPDDDAHLAALLAALPAGARVSHIFVTHAHRDHSALSPRLAAATGAPVLAFGGPDAGRSALMARLAAEGLAGGGEGVDAGFAPDEMLPDGAEIAGPDWHLTALWTPGHMGNHLAFAWGDRIFTGDLAMGWASSLVSPPDGDLTDFLASCRRLAGLGARCLYPGHGAPVDDPAARLAWLVDHREARTAQILAALRAGTDTLEALVGAVYADTDPALHPAAARNLFAHLAALTEAGTVAATPHLGPTARFTPL